MRGQIPGGFHCAHASQRGSSGIRDSGVFIAQGFFQQGNGVAIPHVRNPVVLHGAAPLVMLAFLKEPVDFHAVDGRPVDTLFTLICPTVAIHLRLLSRLVYVLRDEMLHNAIRQRSDAATIIAAVSAAESAIKLQ